MATVKLCTILIVFALICSGGVQIRADSGIEDEIITSDVSDSSFKIELEQLKSKISVLELGVEDKTRESKSKDEKILRMESVLQEKLDSITSLKSEIDSLQKKGSLDVEERVGKAHARAGELEKQVEKLRKEIESQNVKKDTLEARASEAEKKTQELNLKLKSLQKTNDEQKSRIRKTERALQVAEEEMMRAKIEATTKIKELMEVYGAWLPPWFATHLLKCQSFFVTHWTFHGKPALDLTFEKALEKKAQAQKWAEPHMETVKSKWIPVMKEQWLAVTTYCEPHVHTLTTKTVEVYESSKNAIKPHIVKAQNFADPYFQNAKKITKPYIDQVATVTKPHFDKARVALKPYTKKVVHAYGKFLKSAKTYHQQVQGTVQETLNKYELTKPLATKELVWFARRCLFTNQGVYKLRLLLRFIPTDESGVGHVLG
ncbi:hypothetical protein GIB67_023272 [Kingdonia uniflora]|uniref:Uncharacterized protein n=1 Tax=Kingdonia uniflora TaxID=39325 RepID=A0A7J7MSI0_9MAGN|nr:hypothetical protein GIB67_023272 [Kingdonia uniflora]